MMLGVALPDRSTTLLARVGKTNDIDDDFQNPFAITKKAIFSKTKARLADEGIFRRSTSSAEITYQAYAVNYSQAYDFLRLVNQVHRQQKSENITSSDIDGFIPIEEDNEVLTFSYQATINMADNFGKDPKNKDMIAAQAATISIGNTCKTTAINMVEATLGFKTKIADIFFKDLKYKGVLTGGAPDKNSFYIMPPPPEAYENKSTSELMVMTKLYERLKFISQKNASSPETQNKFDSVKKLYNSLAGINNLSANALLAKVTEHESQNKMFLQAKREPNFLLELFNIKTKTKKMFNDLKTGLKNTKQEPVENNESGSYYP